MNRENPTTKKSVYQVITDRIVEQIAQGNVPWHRPWTCGGFPRNFVSRKDYRGINTFVLGCAKYTNPNWLTYRQAQELGGQVRKGEHGWPVVFWKWSDTIKDDDDGTIHEAPRSVRGLPPIIRYYTVFNAEQIDGIDFPKPPTFEHDPIREAEEIVDGMPNRPAIKQGKAAVYYRLSDHVEVPDKQFFPVLEDYYSTLFHELGHSTGHESRLGRHNGKSFMDWFERTGERSKEELCAEMTAAFLCGHCDIVERTIDQSTAYVQSWLRALKNDPQMVVLAAQQAQKAADYILRKTGGAL